MTKVPFSNRVRATTIRATSDILQKQQISPAAALRICDHHLHSSGIIPQVFSHNCGTTRIYEHDWFCVSQAVQCYAHAVSPTESDSSPSSHPSTLLQKVVNGANPCYCDVWVDSDSIGKSSIQFGGLISIGQDVLAAVRRVFVRMKTPDTTMEDSSGKPRSAPFSDQEKQRFRENFGFDALGIIENYKVSDEKKLRDLVPVKRPELNSVGLKTRINELESLSSLSPADGENSFVTRVTVGPQNINFGNHADHAFLAETAFHALTVSTNGPCDYISVQYISEVFWGDVLESYAHRHDEGGVGGNSVILVATRKTTGESKVALIAQGE